MFPARAAAVWEFHIGGYQVLDKYLKSRKGRTLSLGEIEHVARVADSLAFTIHQMAAIDDAIKLHSKSGDKSENLWCKAKTICMVRPG